MTQVFGTVGVGPGWPAMRTVRQLSISIRARERFTTTDDMVVEPAYADIRVSSNGRFVVDLEPGYWWWRIQYGGYRTERLLQVLDTTAQPYEDLVDIDPASLDPIATPVLPTGPMGPQGEQGETGPAGEAPSLRVTGTHVQYQYPSEGAIWHNLIALEDLEGEQGPQGIQGEQGPQGIQGEQGPQGIQGETGPAGESAVVPPGVAGDQTMGRTDVTSSVTSVSQRLVLGYLTAADNGTCTALRMIAGGTATAAGATVNRLGLYEVESNGNLTLVGSTAHDASIGTVASAVYDVSLSTPVALVAGQRYAIGRLVVSAGAVGSIAGATMAATAVTLLEPRMSAIVNAQADLPASVANASLAATTGVAYFEALP